MADCQSLLQAVPRYKHVVCQRHEYESREDIAIRTATNSLLPSPVAKADMRILWIKRGEETPGKAQGGYIT